MIKTYTFYGTVFGKDSLGRNQVDVYTWTRKQKLWQNCNRRTNNVQEDAFFAAWQRSELTFFKAEKSRFQWKNPMHTQKGGC